MKHVVVVGAGQAGSALVAKLRAEGFEGAITLLGAEHTEPYRRPKLSKDYLLGEVGADRLLLRPASFYAQHDIALRLGTGVEAIDREAKTIVTSAGESIGYDALALTTGAGPRRLPSSITGTLGGVFVLRDRDDADRLTPELIEGRRVLIVGGGYLGLEAAAICVKKGLRVVIVESALRILQRVASSQTSDFFRKLHRAHGVEIREGVVVERLDGDERVTRVLLGDGSTIPVDLVVAAIGAEPNVRLAAEAGLAIDNGIWTDEFARTSDPNVWAAGDCASLPFGGRRMRIESIGNAISQAEIAAVNILGREIPYTPATWFWSDQYDVKLQIAGLCNGYERVFVRHSGAARSHWYYRGQKLVAVDAMNDSRAYMVAKRLLEVDRSPPPEKITDVSTDLRTLFAF